MESIILNSKKCIMVFHMLFKYCAKIICPNTAEICINKFFKSLQKCQIDFAFTVIHQCVALLRYNLHVN